MIRAETNANPSEVKGFLDEIERWDAQAKEASEAKGEVYDVMRSKGHNVKAFKKAVSIRRAMLKNPEAYRTEDADVSMYLSAFEER